MALGEAFIEIRADLRPFARDLRRNVRPIVQAFEREIRGAIGEAFGNHAERDGRQIGDRMGRGMRNSILHAFRQGNVFIAIASALAGALDDGISALPTEVKAAIVAGLLLAAPILAAFLTGLLVTAIGVAVAGLGVGLASQFQEVQDAAVQFGRNVRIVLVNSAFSFGQAIITNLALIESRLRGMQGLFTDIFDLSSGFLEPIVQGTLEGIQQLAESLKTSLGDIKPFIDELGAGITILLDDIGAAIELLTRSGDDGVKALRDLLALVGALIMAASALLLVFTKLYGVVRDFILFLNRHLGGISLPLIIIGELLKEIDNRSNRLRSFINTNTEVEGSFEGLIAATKGETDALKELQDAIKDASDAAKSNLELNLRWEESLDRISESLKKNGKTLDSHTEKGRANIKEFLSGLETAEQRAILRVQRGEQTSEQAAEQYRKEVEALRAIATQAGISGQAFDDLFNGIIATSQLRISAEEMGISSLHGEIGTTATAAQKLLDLLKFIKHLSGTIAAGGAAGVAGFADGGIQYLPTMAHLAEDGPEAVIPLTKPARAAQIMRESGLSSMLTDNDTTVMVFIGNEQLDSRMVKVAQRHSAAQGLALSHGGRQF